MIQPFIHIFFLLLFLEFIVFIFFVFIFYVFFYVFAMCFKHFCHTLLFKTDTLCFAWCMSACLCAVLCMQHMSVRMCCVYSQLYFLFLNSIFMFHFLKINDRVVFDIWSLEIKTLNDYYHKYLTKKQRWQQLWNKYIDWQRKQTIEGISNVFRQFAFLFQNPHFFFETQ